MIEFTSQVLMSIVSLYIIAFALDMLITEHENGEQSKREKSTP